MVKLKMLNKNGININAVMVYPNAISPLQFANAITRNNIVTYTLKKPFATNFECVISLIRLFRPETI